jgi:hypothetical protein
MDASVEADFARGLNAIGSFLSSSFAETTFAPLFFEPDVLFCRAIMFNSISQTTAFVRS